MLASLSATQRSQNTQVQTTILRDDGNTPLVHVTFRDKTEMSFDPRTMSFAELANTLDRHSRKLVLKETVESQ